MHARSPQVPKLFEWSSQEAAAFFAVHVIIASCAVTGLRNTNMHMKGEVEPVQHRLHLLEISITVNIRQRSNHVCMQSNHLKSCKHVQLACARTDACCDQLWRRLADLWTGLRKGVSEGRGCLA
ncbi:TPA: hypothetical protein ACH3X2_001859 [Trebouxia sp. C0005]